MAYICKGKRIVLSDPDKK